jgi:hypothetical protein
MYIQRDFLIFIVIFALPISAGFSQSDKKFGILLEGGAVWQSRNDIQIPNETGTRFSLLDVVGNGPYGVFRGEVDFDINERHGLRFVFAPLKINDSGVLPSDVSFAGETFAGGFQTDATYQFSSYRFTYRYRFFNGSTWSWKIGFTGFIRDAKIALSQNGTYAEDTDVGFVPLIHLQGKAKMGENWRFTLDFDGLAASQGRAFDIAAKLGYLLSEHAIVEFGYRTIEGGADVDDVYNFAWLNSVVGAIRFQF